MDEKFGTIRHEGQNYINENRHNLIVHKKDERIEELENELKALTRLDTNQETTRETS